jgi:hypothetical protein
LSEYSPRFCSIRSLGNNGISSTAIKAVEDAIKHEPTAAEVQEARLRLETPTLPLQTLAGEQYLVNGWLDRPMDDVRAVAASQHPALGLRGPDLAVHGTTIEASAPKWWRWTSTREVATVTMVPVFATPWRVIPPGSAAPMLSHQPADVLVEFAARVAAGQAQDAPWTIVWDTEVAEHGADA